MRIISLNLNGIRAAARKGFYEWLVKQDADAVCLQEIKAQEADLKDDIFYPEAFHNYYFAAEKRGYSGVGLYLKQKPNAVIKGLGWPAADTEGRYLQADFDNISIISLYLPSGSSGDIRQDVKFDFLDRFQHHLADLKAMGREVVICGDWNIAHTKKDIKNWRGNQKNSGFLPEERAWMDMLFNDLGYADAFRAVNDADEQYTWWSNRGQAWANNTGWRIDYHIVTPNLIPTVKQASIYKEERFSDHAPLTIDYDFTIKSSG